MNPDQTYTDTSSVFQYDTLCAAAASGTNITGTFTGSHLELAAGAGNGRKQYKCFNRAFSLMPRKVGHQDIPITNEQHRQLQALRPNLFLNNRTADQLCRIWLLLQLDTSDKHGYLKKIESLFLTATCF